MTVNFSESGGPINEQNMNCKGRDPPGEVIHPLSINILKGAFYHVCKPNQILLNLAVTQYCVVNRGDKYCYLATIQQQISSPGVLTR